MYIYIHKKVARHGGLFVIGKGKEQVRHVYRYIDVSIYIYIYIYVHICNKIYMYILIDIYEYRGTEASSGLGREICI